ncbi:HPr kinase/phosphatase C-terminal domain-containing protein [Xanthobacter autotrophicus DSM 431]|uniref:HPr kinase/phosphorylase n=1 Tax=Xanthobacter nonsaccharivorans TaxID=3119912 RepID=UPI0037299887
MAEPPPLDIPSIHASCIAIGETGVLIRGPSGAGKSWLALSLILDAPRALPSAELVADDRVLLAVEAGTLVARPVPLLAGLVEARGLGIRRLASRPRVAVRLLIDLAADDAERMPRPELRRARVQGVELQRLAAKGPEQARLLLAATLAGGDYEN